MTAPPLRTTLVLLTALLTALPVAGCGLSKGPVTVDTNLTEDYAQGRLITLVTNTLGALPASTSLGVQNPAEGDTHHCHRGQSHAHGENSLLGQRGSCPELARPA